MRRTIEHIVVTGAAVAVATGIRWALDDVLGGQLPYFTYYFAVLFAAWWGGVIPGVATMVIGLLIGNYAFAEPRESIAVAETITWFDAFRYLGVGAFVSIACEALHRQRHRIETDTETVRVTLSSIGDAVITTDNDGRIAFMNSVAETATGWKLDEARGVPLESVFPIVNESTRAPVENPASRALREGAIVALANHTVLIRKDDSEIPIDDSAAPIRNSDGKVSGCVLVFRDITERHASEKRIEQLLTQLRDADRRKDEFLATLAHELRNPLAPLRNMLDTMKHANGDAAVLDVARNTMERQLHQLIRLVDDLIDVSRISHDKIELRRERIDLADIIRQSLDAGRDVEGATDHAVHLDLPVDGIELDADPIRLAQVFDNLLSNARKFTPAGGAIEVSVRRDGDEAVVCIRDSGLGIPPSQLESIFTMFAQIDRSPERVHGGLGIGLSLVKRLVQLHGGSVTAISDGNDKGSEFVVRLPIVCEATPPATADATVPEPLPRRRILVVDDNRDAALALAMLLQMNGHEATTSHDGAEALELAEKLRPEVILLDIGLPRMSGHDVCRRLREQAWGKEMLVIAQTGWGQDEDRQRSKDSGFDGHLVKPIDYAALNVMLSTPVSRAG